MICVSIGRSRHKHMLAEFAHLVEQGAELVELRLDYISSRVNIQRLLKDRPCATVVTVRREQDGIVLNRHIVARCDRRDCRAVYEILHPHKNAIQEQSMQG